MLKFTKVAKSVHSLFIFRGRICGPDVLRALRPLLANALKVDQVRINAVLCGRTDSLERNGRSRRTEAFVDEAYTADSVGFRAIDGIGLYVSIN